MANNDVDGGAAPDYRREGESYSSDLRDAEWARLEPMVAPAQPGGRPRKTEMRAAMNAILYLLRTGGPWRKRTREQAVEEVTRVRRRSLSDHLYG